METEKYNRKLTAILSADVEGYSRLMRDDEDATIRTITAYRSAITELVQEYRGRVVDSPGDNILAEFGSVLDAVNCAVEIQRELGERNETLPEDRKMRFRIGVNSGDVVEEDGRIYGDGVNIAARIESLAEAGGISISGTVYDSIEGKSEFEFEFLGEHSVKNINKPIRVYRVLSCSGAAHSVIKAKKKFPKKGVWIAASIVLILTAAFAGLYWKYFYLPTPENVDPENNLSFDLPKGPSIAVLPFDNMSGDPSQEFLCDGLTENIISSLSLSSQLLVIARNSTFAYKGKSIDVREIGRELGADYVLEGSIQKTGNRIRVTVQLIDAKSGNHLHSERYDQEIDNIFTVQDDITMKVMTALSVKLGQGEQLRSQAEGISKLDISLKVLEARDYLFRMNKEGNSLAREKAQEVIEIDPNVSSAYLILGFTHLMDLWFGASQNQLFSFAKATEAARITLNLNDRNPNGHILAGNIFIIKREHEKAIAEMRRAIVLNPNSADAYNFLGYFFCLSGRPAKGIKFMKKALVLNPLPPTWYFHQLGHAYSSLGEYDEAIEAHKKSISIEPNNIFAHIGLTAAYSFAGLEKEAYQAGLEVLRIDPEFSIKEFAKTDPTKNTDVLKRSIEALRKAGLN